MILEKKTPFTGLIFLTAPLFRTKTKKKAMESALLDEELVGSRQR